MRTFKYSKRAASIAVAAVLALTTSAQAQYFGRNKVQYQRFHFEVLHTPHFEIYYYPEEEDAVKVAAQLAERWYARHEVIFHHKLHGPQPLILYASHPQFEETNAISGFLGEGVGGVTEPAKRRIVLPFAGPLRETDHVIGHELVHAFQYDITGHGKSGGSANPAAEQMPLWFIEGMAEYLSLGPIDPNTAMWMREATLKKLPTIKDLDDPEYFPYRYGQALLAYIGSRWGNETIGKLLKAAGRRGDVNAAIDSVLKIKPDSLAKAWHAALHAQYDTLRSQTSKPSDYGPSLISGKNGGGDLNVSPVLSPDGKQLVFFSERDLFSIDLYLADAKTGKIIRNIFRRELDPHFQSLEFINSTGSWDPEGKRFVASAVVKGRPALAIIDVQKGKVEREIPFPDLGEIFDAAWSPDGHAILFSGLAGGFTDLFLYDLETGSTRRLTNDEYAELQPAWSPDGKKIAFVTDQFTTDLSDLSIGEYRLAEMDLATGAIMSLPDLANAKNINPQWSPDGKELYFLSDRGGISNIYRLHLATGTIAQLTNVFGGVSGITDLSPALSVAPKGDRLVYSVYEDGKNNIYAGDSLLVPSRKGLPEEKFVHNPAVLAPPQPGDPLLANLNDPRIGFEPDSSFHTRPYRAGLSLDGVGTTSLGVGADRFGTYVGGGATLFWSDMLGNVNLATALQIQTVNNLVSLGGLVGYFNTAHRWNWGAIVAQTPYLLTSYVAGYNYVNGVPAYVEQDIVFRETDREVSGIMSYPFSDVLRAEFSAGFSSISFLEETVTRAASLQTGELLQNDTQDITPWPALNMGSVSAALVYDNSYFGAASPLLGERYRFEVSPTFGSLNWLEALADYRQYFMPLRPFTIAVRALHYGKYGSGAEDGRLAPLYLGYPGLVRGYDINSMSVSDTSIVNRIQGSKILVGNVELRFPLLGLFGIGKGYYGYFPVEMAGFFDGGVAWQNDDKAWFLGGDRKPVGTIGVALRVNLFGLIGELDYDRPFSRPGAGWGFEFNITPGF
jgi:Tol biopolymer transport system component